MEQNKKLDEHIESYIINWINKSKAGLSLTKLQPKLVLSFCQTPFLGLGLGVDFTFAWDNDNNKNHNHNKARLVKIVSYN